MLFFLFSLFLTVSAIYYYSIQSFFFIMFSNYNLLVQKDEILIFKYVFENLASSFGIAL